MKLAFFDTKPYDRAAFDACLAQYPDITVRYFETRLSVNTAALAQGADAVCVFVNDILDKAVIDLLADCHVRIIALRCAGFNNVDIRYAAKRKIAVVRVPSYSPYAIAEHTMALLLTSVRRIHKAYIRTRDYNFSLVGMTGFDLHGKTVGVIGTGRIGRAFIRICHGFGMHVLAYDKYPDRGLCDEGVRYTPLDTMFENSDILSLHCPLTPDTYHIINETALSRCKRGVVLLNTSRGALVDAEALLAAIKSRHVGAACLDVYEEESDLFFEDNSGHILDDDTLARLISMPNVIVSSHQAFLTEEALANIAHTTLENLIAVQSGNACANLVACATYTA